MTLLQLKYIVKIVECGSMNEASHALYVSQPALSSSVKELENELGIEIFTRSSQGIALTVDGAEFLTYARQVLDQADLLEERYKHAKPRKQLCQVSTQHYMFAVEAFVEMINSIKSDEYEFTIRETRTRGHVANRRPRICLAIDSETLYTAPWRHHRVQRSRRLDGGGAASHQSDVDNRQQSLPNQTCHRSARRYRRLQGIRGAHHGQRQTH